MSAVIRHGAPLIVVAAQGCIKHVSSDVTGWRECLDALAILGDVFFGGSHGSTHFGIGIMHFNPADIAPIDRIVK